MPRANPEFTPVTHESQSYRRVTYTGVIDWYGPLNTKTYGAGSAGVVPYIRYYSSVSTPNFWSKWISGQLPYNSHTVEFNWVTDGPYLSEAKSWDGWTYCNRSTSTATMYSFTPLQVGLDNGLTDAKNKAVQRLGNQASGVRFNAAQFFGERKQTAELLAGTANRVVSAVRALRRADLVAFTRALSLSGTETRSARSAWRRVERTPASKRVASHWLEYVYGWKPLLQDAYDAAELLAERIHDQKEPEGVLYASGSTNRLYGASTLQGWGYPEAMKWFSAKAKVVYKCHYRLESDARSLLAQTGISNPALLAWELLPYSFVVDWFVPIGTYLESLMAFDGFELVSSRSGVVHKEEWAFELNYSKHTSDLYRSGTCTKRTFRYSRVNVNVWPEYVLKVRSPVGGNAATRFATAASLLRVLFK